MEVFLRSISHWTDTHEVCFTFFIYTTFCFYFYLIGLSKMLRVSTPLLKFVEEFVLNKTQRLTFDSSSPNGILLFCEVCNLWFSMMSSQNVIQTSSRATRCREVPFYVVDMGLYAEFKEVSQHLLSRELEHQQ